MMKFALIVAGIVHSTPEYAERPELAPNIVLIELPEGSPVQAGWLHQGGEVFSEPAPMEVDWPTLIAARRYQAEIAGVDIEGMHVDTDDRSKLLINGAVMESRLDTDYVMQWKTPAGFVELGAAQVLAVARAVRAHVQACFDHEAELLEAVSEGGIDARCLRRGGGLAGKTRLARQTVGSLVN